MLTRDQVISAYQLILQRMPEDEAAISYHIDFGDLFALGRHMMDSPEFKQSRQPDAVEVRPQFSEAVHEHHIVTGYASSDLAVFERFHRYVGEGRPGFVTNFLGARTRCDLQTPLLPFDGAVEGLPQPVGSTQGETAEWIGTLRSVAEADGQFRLLELGAGYGPWMAITCLAARQQTISDIHVYGVEGDVGHVEFAHINMRDNDIPEAEYTVIHSAVGAEDGVIYWPVHDDPGGTYGGRPMEADGSSYLGTTLGQVVEVPVVGINGLLQRESRWDLVHIDIQGHEGDVCRAGITEMTRRVHRVVIGTHSRVQDGIVMDIFHKAGWALENEKPTIAIWRPEVPTVEGMAIVDGVQVWRNPYV